MSANADRQRRYRERLKAERSVLTVEVDLFGLVDAMIEAGMLNEAQSDDKCRVAVAAAAILRKWQVSVTRNASNGVGGTMD